MSYKSQAWQTGKLDPDGKTIHGRVNDGHGFTLSLKERAK